MPRHALALSLQFVDASHRDHLKRHHVTRWIGAALQRPAQITVRIVGEDEARRLNHEFRGDDHATNVLTFDYAQTPTVVADLVVCAPVVAREANAQHIDISAHYAHLLVHGVLHAQGLDHQHDAEAARMESRESDILTALGFDDPYRRD